MIGSGFWYWRGSVVIKVKGPRLERFLNSAARAGVALRNVERLSAEMLVATIPAQSYRQVRSLARAGAWHIHIVRRIGLPFTLHKLLRRKGLLAGGILCLAALYVLSTVVWFVNVEGTTDVPIEKILAVAREHGLRPGASKRAFSEQVVERELLLTLTRLAWANIEVRGTLVTIHVADKIVPDSDLTTPGNIVAARSGVIEELVTMRGVPMVRKGDTVEAGQLLISGLIPPEDPAHAQKLNKGEPPYIRAQGIVRARVWHDGYAEAALQQSEEELTGRVHRQLLWEWKGRTGSFGSDAPFRHYREHTTVLRPGVGRWRLPGALIMRTRQELNRKVLPVDAELARTHALDAAWEQVKSALPAGAEIDKPPQISVDTVVDGNIEVVRARVALEAVEDIARFEPVATAPNDAGAFRPVLGPPPKVQPTPGP